MQRNHLAAVSALLIVAGTLTTLPAIASSTAVLTGLRVTGWTSSTAGLAWNAPITGTAPFTYWVRADGNTPESRVVTTGSTVTANFALTPGVHQLSVVALDANNQQVSSDRSVTVDTRAAFTDTTPPQTPRDVTSLSVGATDTFFFTGKVNDDSGKLVNFQMSDDGGATWRKAFRDGQFQLYFTPNFHYVGLPPGSRRTLAVRAVDAAGLSSAPLSVPVTTKTAADGTPPTSPGRLRVERDGSGNQVLAWDASADNSGAISRYQIYRADDPGLALYPAQLLWLSGTKTSIGITDLVDRCLLVPGTTYTINVRALDATGNISSATNTVSFTA